MKHHFSFLGGQGSPAESPLYVALRGQAHFQQKDGVCHEVTATFNHMVICVRLQYFLEH